MSEEVKALINSYEKLMQKIVKQNNDLNRENQTLLMLLFLSISVCIALVTCILIN